jgi:hypothetical protein
MIVYIYEPGVLGVVVSEHPAVGCVVKWFLDGIEFTAFLEHEEYLVYEKEGGMDV